MYKTEECRARALG